MKNLKLVVLASLLSTFVMAINSFPKPLVISIELEPERPLALFTSPPPTTLNVKIPIIKSHSKFLHDLGFRESSNNYKIVNQYGYLGKYQFGRKTLNSIGMENISNRKFLSSPKLQEEAMQRLMTSNYKSLKRYINKYEGEIVHGVLITKSGILAAAHLGGAGNVRKWFRRGVVFKDANGTKITSYMKQFGGYKIEI